MRYIIILFFTFDCVFSQTADYSKNPDEGNYSEYISKEGFSIKQNEKIKIGFPSMGNKFVYLVQGNDLVDARLNNIEVVIDKIIIQKLQNGSLKSYATFKGFGIPVYIDIEAAIYFKEIIIQ